jgi:hypothetical protein
MNSKANHEALSASDRAAGSAHKTPEGVLVCARCNAEMEWEDCSACGGDGFFAGHEEDPNWYHPGELVACRQCGGTGGAGHGNL